MMKKLVYRAGAVIMAALLFFCSIIYSSVPVYGFTWMQLVYFLGSQALGYAFNKGADELFQQLGWTSADIQVDENGNVILSESQMQELKDAIEGYTQDENGNDKYGMYLYESTAALQYRNFLGINAHFDPDYWQDRGNVDLVRGLTDVWFVHSNYGSYCNAPPAGSIWVCPSPSSQVVYFYESGTYSNVSPHVFQLYWEGSNWVWHEREQSDGSGSVDASYNYYGKPHTCFRTLKGAMEWENDNNPYTLVPPTYTGGSLVIPADQLHGKPGVSDNDTTVSGNDFDDDGNPITEKGWLQRIYERLGDILDQVKQIKWLTVVDVVINAIDTFGESVGNIASALVDAISQVFPLCILWDVVRIVEIFEAEPIPPVFDINLKWDLIGVDQTFKLDLTQYDLIFTFLRMGEIIMFLLELSRITMEWVGKGDDVI